MEFARIDANLSAAINGDDGSTHAPSSPVALGGAGAMATGVWVLSGSASIIVDEGATVPSQVVFGDSDYPTLLPGHPGRLRKLSMPLVGNLSNGDFDGSSRFPGARAVFPLDVHHGARFVSVTVAFEVTNGHGPVPDLPRFRVFALDVRGVSTSLLVGAPPSGFLPYSPRPPDPTPGGKSTWGPDGYLQDGVFIHYFVGTIVPNIVVDVERFTYWIDIIDESGPYANSGYPGLSGNAYFSAVTAFEDIADLRPQ